MVPGESARCAFMCGDSTVHEPRSLSVHSSLTRHSPRHSEALGQLGQDEPASGMALEPLVASEPSTLTHTIRNCFGWNPFAHTIADTLAHTLAHPRCPLALTPSFTIAALSGWSKRE